jgi:hypothetical protein
MILLEKIEKVKQASDVLKASFKKVLEIKGVTVADNLEFKDYPALVQMIPEDALADTSMATATSADLVQGKTAVVNGELISGDIVPLGGLTVTPDVVPVTIPAGFYTADITVDTIPLDGDAIAADIIEGATARVGGQLITGTLPILEALNITPGLEGADFGRGLYAGVKVKPLKEATLTKSGVLTVKATAGLLPENKELQLTDKNLIPDNILKGVTIFGVEGAAASGGGEYYLCTYVNRTYETGEFTVSGLPDDLFMNLSDWDGNLYPEEYRTKNPNGTFAPYYTEGSLSEWKFRNEHGAVIYYNGEWMAWVFAPFAQGETDYWLSSFPVRASCSWENMKYPWDSSLQWTLNDNAFSPAIAPVVPPPVEPYWNGYKLVQNESGKYDIDYSEELKLAYADFMPVAGRFYDSGCSVEIGAANLEEKYLYSTPTNMTSNENAEWVITASSEYTNSEYDPSSGKYVDIKHYAYHAFDGNDSTYWWEQYGSNTPFIQWHNKKHKVLLKRLLMQDGGGDTVPGIDQTNTVLEASNDGVTWVKLPYANAGYDYSIKGVNVLLPDNYEFYSYYRVYRGVGSSRWQICSIKGYYLNEREVPK